MQANYDYPGVEYLYLGRFIGNIITIIRMSIGDNNFDGTIYLESSTNIVFWIVWILTLYVTCIIFLNFIIAEACESYQRVSQNIGNNLQFQKVCLIHESEEMLWPWLKTQDNFPKFTVIREMEE